MSTSPIRHRYAFVRLLPLLALICIVPIDLSSGGALVPSMRFQSKIQKIAWWYGSLILPSLVIADDSTESEETFYSSSDSVPPILRSYVKSKSAPPRKRAFPLADGYSHEVTLSADAERARIREKVYGADYSVPQSYTLDEYITARRDAIQRSIQDSMMHSYDLQKALAGGNLANMLSQATNLVIPLPPNPLMSIFGKPQISVSVNGEINVRAGWRWDTQNLGVASAFGQTQSTPMFSQDIRLNVSGGIGDKLRMGIDWNTRNQFEFDNRFKVGFEGYDDDIVRLVEAGNVQLQTPATLIGGSQALFGVRADFQFGPVFLKTIASQKRGERRFVTLESGSVRDRFQLRAYEYSENHFFLDTAYKAIWRSFFAFNTPAYPQDPTSRSLRVKDIEVWESTARLQDAQASDAIAYAELPDLALGQRYPDNLKNGTITAGSVERARFLRLDRTRYVFDANLGTITILNLRRDAYYAVSYRTEGPTPALDDDRVTGTFTQNASERDTLVLKLMYRPNMLPGFTSLWARQMRNRYFIGRTNVDISQSDLSLFYLRRSNDSTDILDGTSEKIVTVLRVDQVNNSNGSPPADGQFDINNTAFFDPTRGEITFPSLEPFREGLTSYFGQQGNPAGADRFTFPAVYDTTKEVARLQTERDRFIITGNVSGQGGNRISLPNGFNTAPGSVRVTLDGQQLQEGVDYTVEYISGQVVLRNQRAQLPGARLNIEYEQNDIFNLTTRTLVGARVDLDMKSLLRSRTVNSNLGFTFMSFDQALVNDRVTIGQEPVSNQMFGFDGQMTWQSDFLTELVDKLPFYDTKEQSTFNIRGEWAMMLPEANKRISDVPSDGGLSVVYVDDFEGGAQTTIRLGLEPANWHFAAPPIAPDIGQEDSTVNQYRGQLKWWRYFIGRTPAIEVYPNRSVQQGNANLSELLLDFSPDRRGIYNRNPLFTDSSVFTQTERSKIWGGMTRLLSSFTNNFDTDNIEYLEIMMRVEAQEQGNTRLFVDFGQISEDIISNGVVNTEDGITAANPLPNNLIDPGEDVGIDGLTDEQERALYPAPLSDEADPARDNFVFDFGKDPIAQVEGDFDRYNGLEGNAGQSLSGQTPDSEVLNRQNGQNISLLNDYFTVEVNLDQSEATNPQIVGGANGWRLYRIPVRRDLIRVGNPQFANIQYVRVRAQGGTLRARIADWRFVGSQWIRFGPEAAAAAANGTTDTVVSVSFINREENSGAPDFYTMPPGVQPPRLFNNPNRTQGEFFFNEQSLAVNIKRLRYGEERSVARFYRSFDMFYYKRLKFFMHGDNSMPDDVPEGTIAPAYGYIRFGIDSLNYYEYRVPLLRGWKDIDVDLQQLTSIKQLRDSAGTFQRLTFPVPGRPGHTYAIYGNPILTRVQFLAFGVYNPSERFPNYLTTTMWVNELRLLDADSRSDWAAVMSSNLKLADLANMSFSLNRTNPNFHRLEERFGNRIAATNWSFSIQAQLEKFFPADWKGMAIPVTYSHTEQVQDPLFAANSDVNLAEAVAAAETQAFQSAKNQGLPDDQAQFLASQAGGRVRARSQTIIIQDQFAMQGIRLGIPGRDWYVRDILNRFTFGYNYTQQFERSPVVQERFNWQWQASGQFGVTIPSNFTAKPLAWAEDIPILGWYKGLSISFLPGNVSTGLTLARSRQTEQSWFINQPSPVIRAFTANRQMQLGTWKLTEGGLMNVTMEYNVNAQNTLIPLELDDDKRQLSGSEIFSRMVFRNGGILDLGATTQHSQTMTFNFRPTVPPLFSLDRYLNITGSYSTVYNWNDPLQPSPEIRDIVKNASFDNTIRFNATFRLKSLGNEWFGTPTTTRGGSSADTGSSFSFSSLLKTIFFDYDNVTLQFSQRNAARSPGVMGGSGFTNFWARPLTFQGQENIFGPSLWYQLGLVTNPHGSFSINSSSAFPFISFSENAGLRPPNATLQDNFNQATDLSLRTSRALWQGATLELSWTSRFSFNRNQTVLTDAVGNPTFTNITIIESYNRSFLIMPRLLFFDVFGNNVESVVNAYNTERDRIVGEVADTAQRNQQLAKALSDAFVNELEAFNFLPAALSRVLPRLNWTFRWEGLEKWDLLDGVARRITLNHTYNSQYQENNRVTDLGRVTESQQVQMNFSPLIGITAQFDENKLDGTLTANLQYNMKSAYSLATSARSLISRDDTDEFTLRANYSKRGWEFPLFGLVLQNDLEFQLEATYRKNRRATFDVLDFQNESGRTLDGSTTVILEPSARYSLSRYLTARAFVRYEANMTEGAANPGNSTTQVGVDIRLAVSGGR